MFSLLLRRMRLKLMPQDEEEGLNDSSGTECGSPPSSPRHRAARLASQMPSQLPLDLDDVLEQALPAHTIGIHLEAVTVAAIQIRIEDDREHIVDVEDLPLPQHAVGDLTRVGFDHLCPNVQSILRIENTHAGRLSRGSVFLREYLVKVLDQGRLRPHGFVEHAVNGRSIGQLRNLHRLRHPACSRSAAGRPLCKTVTVLRTSSGICGGHQRWRSGTSWGQSCRPESWYGKMDSERRRHFAVVPRFIATGQRHRGQPGRRHCRTDGGDLAISPRIGLAAAPH
jgi:hypothetical protein